MQPSRILIGLAPLLATALAFPTSPSESGPLSNDTRIALARRDGYDTSIEIGDDIVIAWDQSGNPPQAFNVLWDAVENELCTRQGCDFNAQKCVPAAEGGLTICISAQGDFLPGNRDDIIHAARGAYFRTIVDGGCGPAPFGDGTYCSKSGTNLVDLNAVQGPYSGFGIRVELTEYSGNDQCGQSVQTIAQGGSTLPEIGIVFGLIGFFCSVGSSGSPMLTLQATG